MNKKCLSFPNKKRYSTQKLAQVAILLQNVALDTYFCEDCSGWHLTKIIKK